MRKEFLKQFLFDTDETGRFIVKSSLTGITYFVEPIYEGRTPDWGDVDPVTKKLTGNYGSKYTGAVLEKESLIKEEYGITNIGYFMGSPLGEIERRDRIHAEILKQC